MTTSGSRTAAGRDQIASERRILAVLETIATQPGGVTPKAIRVQIIRPRPGVTRKFPLSPPLLEAARTRVLAADAMA